jgi:dihydroorotate dehydrogenase (NAD+) catalytic subunit
VNLDVDLVTEHKWGLTLANPILVAAGFAGYGATLGQIGELSALGGIITNPVSPRPWQGSQSPRFYEFPGGVLLHTGNQNPGFRYIAKTYGSLWSKLDTVVIAHICGSHQDAYLDLAVRLEGIEGLSALELSFPWSHREGWDIPWGLELIEALDGHTLYPLLVQLPIWADKVLAEEIVEAGADVLVIAAPPHGVVRDEGGAVAQGETFGPFALPIMLERLQRLTGALSCPIIARGGIHTLDDILACLTVGAWAVQLDAVLWRQPDAPWILLDALQEWMTQQGLTDLGQLREDTGAT